MFIAGVVRNKVDDHLEVLLVAGGKEALEVFKGSESEQRNFGISQVQVYVFTYN